MLRKENMLRKFLVYVMTSDYPSICFNHKFLETTKKEHISGVQRLMKSVYLGCVIKATMLLPNTYKLHNIK